MTEGMERYMDVAMSERRNRGVAGWWCGGGGMYAGVGARKLEVSGCDIDGINVGDTDRDGPPPYNRAMHILCHKGKDEKGRKNAPVSSE